MFSKKNNNLLVYNEVEINNKNYFSSQYNVSNIRRYLIIKKINKQKHNALIEINGEFDLKKSLFWKNGYLVIPDKYLNKVSSSRCKEFDIYNKYIYKKNYKLYNQVMKKINKSNLKLESSPQPLPKFTNLERQFLYYKRNENTNNLLQTNSVLYLLKNGYIIVNDLNNLVNKDNKIIYFESYQAIELAQELAHIRGDNLLHFNFTSLFFNSKNNSNSNDNSNSSYNSNNNCNSSSNSNNNCNSNDNCNSSCNSNDNCNSSSNSNDNCNSSDNCNDKNEIYNNNNKITIIPSAPEENIIKLNINNSKELTKLAKNNNSKLFSIYNYSDNNEKLLNSIWVETEKRELQNKMMNEINISGIKCKNPEHHSLNDKINHFSTQQLNSNC